MIDYDGPNQEFLKKLCKKFGGQMISGNYLMSVSYNPKTDKLEVGR